MDYLHQLYSELEDAQKRYERADAEGKVVVKTQIRQIKRDIRRNSKIKQEIVAKDALTT